MKIRLPSFSVLLRHFQRLPPGLQRGRGRWRVRISRTTPHECRINPNTQIEPRMTEDATPKLVFFGHRKFPKIAIEVGKRLYQSISKPVVLSQPPPTHT